MKQEGRTRLAVVLEPRAARELRALPLHVRSKLEEWVWGVENWGIGRMRQLRGYRDEALKGRLRGRRSVRLSRSYRAIYSVRAGEDRMVLAVERVTRHVYR